MTLPEPGAGSTLELMISGYLEGLPDVSSSPGGAGRTWLRGSVEFAVVGPFGAEVRLDRQVASAAIRTPDTAPSPRGPDWVRFNPRELDPHALDRLEAWLDLAHRRAEE